MPTSPLLTASESTASTRLREGGAVVRKAKLPDAVNIFDLVNSLSGDGTLLRRSYAEICENVRDFAVAESPSLEKQAASSSAAEPSISTAPTSPRSAPSSSSPKPKARAPAASSCAPSSKKPKSKPSPPSASSPVSPTSSSTSASASSTALPCPTRSTRTARPARASTPATRWPWSADRCPRSPSSAPAASPNPSWSSYRPARFLLRVDGFLLFVVERPFLEGF